jgi:hypothetical protein
MVKPTYNLPESHGDDDDEAIRHWLDGLASHYPTEELKQIAGACAALTRCRGDRRIETGETHVRHVLSTADILVRLRMDFETLIAALLNGCLDQGDLTEVQLEDRFGPGIARMVGDLSRIGQIANVDAIIAAKDQDEHEENLRRLLLGIAEDVRVVLVVLAERVHLMRAIKDLEPERRAKIARDTQRIYAPLANRLGIWQVKWELEDLSLRYLKPDEYKRIAKLWPSAARSASTTSRRHPDPARQVRRGRHRGRDHRPPETHLQHLAQDAAQGGRDRRDLRPARGAHPGRHGRGLLRRARAGARTLEAHPQGVRRLHRHPQGQHVSVAAHRRGRAGGQAAGGADPHPRDAPACRVRCRRPLGLQGVQGA